MATASDNPQNLAQGFEIQVIIHVQEEANGSQALLSIPEHPAWASTPVPILTALERLQEETRRYRRRRPVTLLLTIVTVIAVSAILATIIKYLIPFKHFGVGGISGGIAVLAYGLLEMVALRGFRQTLSQMKTVLVEDKRAVGPLVDALSIPEPNVHKLIVSTLTQLLPLLTPADRDLLTPTQRQKLISLLRWEGDPFCLAILKALEQIGDEKAIPAVERLTRRAKNADVREAAQACLPFLQLAADNQRVRQTLLHPSERPASTDTLLRAASGNHTAEPQTLLRAGQERSDTRQ